jgi:UDP-glucuronate 4-epimerase
MPRTLLLTGAAGFIGSHTAVALAARGDRVVGLDSFHPYYDVLRKRANVREITEQVPGAAFELVEGDIRDRELVDRLFRQHRFDGVIHLAAMAGVRASVDDPFTYNDVNVTGTLVLLEAASRHGAPGFVFASTSSAYGASVRLPFTEDDAADRPLAPYPASKRACELLGHAFHHDFGLPFTALRFFTVYGPRGRPDMLTYKLLDAIHTGRPLVLYEGGRMLRDWTFVSDIVAGVVAAVDARLGYEIVNLGRGKPVLVSEYVRVFETITGKKVPFEDAPRLDSDVERTHANIEKAGRLLGYAPRVDVEEGARRFVDWFERAVLSPGKNS